MNDARVLGKIYSILYRVKLNWNVGLLLLAFSYFNICLIPPLPHPLYNIHLTDIAVLVDWA